MREVDEAAEQVVRAMRALDAHRHGSAPTLEREYRRALEAYFVATQRTLGKSDVDDTDIDALSGTDRAGELEQLRASIHAHYAAARQALRLARAYRREPRTTGRRERECIESIQRHRASIRTLRLRVRPAAEQLLLPGLAKTRPTPVEGLRTVHTKAG
jgi:hypothetical protein